MTQEFRTDPQLIGSGYPIIGGNSLQFSKVDALTVNTSGFLIVATANTDRILGFSNDDRTMASDNQTVAKVKPNYIPAIGTEIFITSDAAETQTNIGEYQLYSTFTTGVQQIAQSTSSATVGQVLVLGFDPYNEGTTTLAVVTPARFLALSYTPS